MFGKSIFQSVLDRLEAEDATADGKDDAPVHAGIRGLNASFALDTAHAAGSGTVRQAYADMADAEPPLLMPDAMPAPPAPPVEQAPEPLHLKRTKPVEIAEDLGLSATETPASLNEKRRLFASANHPDRHAPEHRAAATKRMTIANMLIDEAVRRIRHGRTSGQFRQGSEDGATTRRP